eukprot:s592_g8.t1
MSSLAQFGADSFKALSWWRGIQSPIYFAISFYFLTTVVIVVYMVPHGSSDSEPDPEEPEPEDSGDAIHIEPTAEPPTSKSAMNERSLGTKYPTVLSDPMVPCEGSLVWMHHRCELRVARDNKVIHNRFRMQTLAEMLRICQSGMSENQNQRVQQCYQAWQYLLSMVPQRGQQRAADPDDSDMEEGEQRQHERYLHSNLSDVSQPDLWMESHHEPEETAEERERRYMFSERREVSDGGHWDEMLARMMFENEQINNETFSETEVKLDREEMEERNEHTR